MQRRFASGLAFILVGIVCAFQLWLLGFGDSGVSHATRRLDLIDSYVRALGEGRSYITEPGVGQPLDTLSTDSSYFNGKIYIYYGILPFASVFVPWYWITGTFLNAEVYIGLILCVGHLLLAWGFWRLESRKGGEGSPWRASFGAMVAILGAGSFALLDLPNIHQVESSTGYALNCAIFFALVSFEYHERRRFRFLVLAVLAAACLMGCRPNLVLTVVWALGVACFWVWRDSMAPERKRWRIGLLLAVPAVVAILLGGYNFVRFDNPFEFGMNYGTGAIGRAEVVGFSLRNLSFNFLHYLVGPFQSEPYFPFIGGPYAPDSELRPEFHEGLSRVYGIFVIYPALVFVGAAFFSPRRWLACVFILPGLAALFFLSGLGFGTYRYTVDFSVWVSIVAGLGVISFCRSGSIYSSLIRHGLALMVIVISAIGAVCLAASLASLHNNMEVRRPDDFQSMARLFNRSRYLGERIAGWEPTSLALLVKFPERYGAVEPLLVTGVAGLQDFLYVHYLGTTTIRFGFESMGLGGPVSPPIALDYTQPHRVELIMGNRLPPPDHPAIRDLSSEDIARLEKSLVIMIDGTEVFRALVEFHPRRGYDYFGRSPFNAAFGGEFTGTMERVEGRPLRALLP